MVMHKESRWRSYAGGEEGEPRGSKGASEVVVAMEVVVVMGKKAGGGRDLVSSQPAVSALPGNMRCRARRSRQPYSRRLVPRDARYAHTAPVPSRATECAAGVGLAQSAVGAYPGGPLGPLSHPSPPSAKGALVAFSFSASLVLVVAQHARQPWRTNDMSPSADSASVFSFDCEGNPP